MRNDVTLLTPRDSGKILNLTSAGVVRLDKVGDLTAVRDSSGRRLFRREDVERLKAKRQAARRRAAVA